MALIHSLSRRGASGFADDSIHGRRGNDQPHAFHVALPPCWLLDEDGWPGGGFETVVVVSGKAEKEPRPAHRPERVYEAREVVGQVCLVWRIRLPLCPQHPGNFCPQHRILRPAPTCSLVEQEAGTSTKTRPAELREGVASRRAPKQGPERLCLRLLAGASPLRPVLASSTDETTDRHCKQPRERTLSPGRSKDQEVE